MSAALAQAAPKRRSSTRAGHAIRLGLGIAAAVVLIALLAAYGFDYYTLDLIHRIDSPKHALLKPSGVIGRRLGMLGGVMFLLLFLYPIRKRWRWLGRKGNTKHWLDFHILLGLTAPVIISFHSAFKLQGIAGVAWWTMMAVVASGIIGRYLYAQLPRTLDTAETSLEEISSGASELMARVHAQQLLDKATVTELLRMPSAAEVQRMPLLRSIAVMIWLDLRRVALVWKLRLKGNAAVSRSRDFRAAIASVRRQAALSKRVLFLSKAEQIFHLWHVVHRPFSYSFVLLAGAHIVTVLLLGF